VNRRDQELEMCPSCVLHAPALQLELEWELGMCPSSSGTGDETIIIVKVAHPLKKGQIVSFHATTGYKAAVLQRL